MSSDPFDDDDLFNDAETLAQLDRLEQQAIQLSQAQPAKRQTKPYHHTVTQPKAGPSKPPTFGGRKEPAPLRTEPGVKTGGFGWEHGGKRSIDGNVQRHIAQVEQRQAYWQKDEANGNVDGTSSGYSKDDESYPSIVLNKDGGYGLEEAEVVDKHTLPPTTLLPVGPRAKTPAEIRREAIQRASREPLPAIPEPSGSQQTTPFTGCNRTFARSISAGNHPISRTTFKSSAPALPTIPSSQRASTPPLPASQGSIARRAALELDDEKRKLEDAQIRIAQLQRQLEEERTRPQRTGVLQPSQRAAQPDAPEVSELQAKFKALQADFWKAKGEAENIRRAQKDAQGRFETEKERLKRQVAEVEAKLREREKESARMLENIKAQAVFAVSS